MRSAVRFRLPPELEAAFEEGLTEKRVSGETIRATLSRRGAPGSSCLSCTS